MKPKTKLFRLLEDANKGISSANGALSKILRTLWKDLGFSYEQMGMLMEKWLADPANEYDPDPTSINNSRGNLRKDHERDDLTWKLFLRNLRVMYPKEVRFLFRLRFKDGTTYRQVAIMRPPSSHKFNSDEVIKNVKWDYLDEDGFCHTTASIFDDEGLKEGEEDYLPRSICIFDENEEGFHYCSSETLFKYIKDLPKSKCNIETKQVDDLFETILPLIRDTWEVELGDHLKRIGWADPSCNVISYRGNIVDGHHRIVRAKLLGLKELKVIHLESLPKLSYIDWKDCKDNLTARINFRTKRKS